MAVQTRIISPFLGIFKGMLIKKEGISKIQLPSSMKKVGPSERQQKKKDSQKKVFLLFKNIFPSTAQEMMERIINPNNPKKPTKSSTLKLRPLGPMVEKVLIGCGVPTNKMITYSEGAQFWEGRKHAYLVGVSDCTNGGLPEGKVFISGLGIGGKKRKVLVTRTPCTEVDDMAILPMVSSKCHSVIGKICAQCHLVQSCLPHHQIQWQNHFQNRLINLTWMEIYSAPSGMNL